MEGAARDLLLLVATWNVGNRKPEPAELEEWLPSNGGNYDVIVIGTQENGFKEDRMDSRKHRELRDEDEDEDEDEDAAVTPMDSNNVLLSDESTRRKSVRPTIHRKSVRPSVTGAGTARHAWDAMCEERLGSSWVAVAHVALREMRLSIWCTSELARTSVQNVATAYAATGIAGIIANKGGLVARLTIGNVSFAFCSCHLAAHEGSAPLANRNAMVRKVLLKTMGGNIGGTIARQGRRHVGRPLDAAHAVDHIIWLGDLNYRLDLRLVQQTTESHAAHVEAVQKMVEAEEWDTLLKADQLCAARAAGEAFVGFSEGEMHFPPTFKVERGPGTKYLTQRTPSWCDRILWKSMPPVKANLVQTMLTSVPCVTTSDHKPVVCAFRASPSPRIARTPDTRVIIRVTNLTLKDIMGADLTGTSDPYCQFYTHPEDLLRHTRAPKTTVKWRVLPGEEALWTGGAAGSGAVSRNVRRSGGSLMGKLFCGAWATPNTSLARWKDSQVPSINVGGTLESVQGACLLIAVFDYDRWKANDPLGVVTVPIAYRGGQPLPQQLSGYALEVDEPIVFGLTTKGTGRLTCTLHIERHNPTQYKFTSYLYGFIRGAQRRRHAKAREHEDDGNYVAAAGELDQATQAFEIGDADIGDAEMIRSRVHDLTRLAEMKWRYRAVEQGESPPDAAIETLGKAQSLLDLHRQHVLGTAPSADPTAATHFRLSWAAEQSAVLHGLCATRLIFKRGDDATIEADLGEALKLRSEAGLALELADSLNSLGSLKQRQRRYDEAQRHYARSLELRQRTRPQVHKGGADAEDGLAGDSSAGGSAKDDGMASPDTAAKAEKMQQQMIAQSLVSLGNLAIERGDAERGDGDEPSAAAKAFYGTARSHFEAALQAYVRGFHDGHPKVAWAHEGLGRSHEKEGNVKAAIAQFERATEIRRRAMEVNSSGKMELFRNELEASERKSIALRSSSQLPLPKAPPSSTAPGPGPVGESQQETSANSSTLREIKVRILTPDE